MPSEAQFYRLDKHQRPDFVRSDREPFEVAAANPQTQEEIRSYLEDIGASAIAAANQFTDSSVVDEVYDDMAMRVYEDVSSGFYPLEAAIARQQYRELGFPNFSYTESAVTGEDDALAS